MDLKLALESTVETLETYFKEQEATGSIRDGITVFQTLEDSAVEKIFKWNREPKENVSYFEHTAVLAEYLKKKDKAMVAGKRAAAILSCMPLIEGTLFKQDSVMENFVILEDKKKLNEALKAFAEVA